MNPEMKIVNGKYKKTATGFLALGIAAVVFSLFKDQERAWANILLNNIYFLLLAVSGLVFIAIHYLAGAGWWVAIRRVPEAMTSFLPVGAVLMMLLFFGRHSLYEWSHHEEVLKDPVLLAKSSYLNTPFFFLRMAIIVLVWTAFGYFLRKFSHEQDVHDSLHDHKKLYRLSALFLPLFALTLSVASVDWLMSLEPHWFSTIFTFYTFSGMFLNGIAFLTLVVILMKERGYLQGVNENHLHDLGKLVFGFSTLWAYIWLSQYLLIWYSNIPEETVYYHIRTDSDWVWLFLLNLVMNWLIPFLILLPRSTKRNAQILKRVCILLLIGHWLDLYIMGVPNVVSIRHIGITEILVALGYGAGFFLVISKTLEGKPLMPRNDPYIAESLHHSHSS